MIRVAFALPPALDEVAVDAQRHGHQVVATAGSAQHLAEQLAEQPASDLPHVAVVGGGARYLTAELVSACDDAGTRLVAVVADEHERRRSVTLGIRDLVDAPAGWPQIEQLFAPTEPGPAEAARGGTVIAVWGPHGAPGRTSVAIAIAAELAATEARVVLADVDTHAASIAPMLGLLDEAPGFAAACRLASTDSLDALELDRIAETAGGRAGSFRVLTGIGRPARWPELGTAQVTSVLRSCRDWADFVVVDVAAGLESDEEIVSDLGAPRRNAATLAVLADAGQVVAVGNADPVGLSRLLRAYADLTEAISTRNVHVLINRLRSGAVGLSPATQVTQTLQRFGGIPTAGFVPFDLAAFDAALLAGGTLIEHAPRSAARTALQEFALTRFADPALHPRRRGRRVAERSARV